MKLRLASLALAVSAVLAPPLPAQAPPTPTARPFEVAQIDPTSWYGRFGFTNCSWIDLGEGVFVIDTGASVDEGKNLMSEIARTTKNKPVKWVAMTHLHSDSNDGFAAFLPSDVTIFVNARATGQFAPLVAKGGKAPRVVGVSDRISFLSSTQVLEIGVPSSNAHTDFDLYVFLLRSRTAFVGDLVTPDRCPMMSDPATDPKGWLKALDRLDSLGAEILVPTRGNATKTPTLEIDRTRKYVSFLLDFLVEKKKENAPEARVSGELAARKMGEYCPRELNAINALAIYRRLTADGSVKPAAAPPAKK